MARVTDDEVYAILDQIDSSINIDPFISTATLLVDEELVDKGMTESRLTNIELWLSAHFASIANMKSLVDDIKDGVSVTVQAKVGLNFNATVYGQTAIMLDTSSTLINMQNRAAGLLLSSGRVSLDWLGTDEDE